MTGTPVAGHAGFHEAAAADRDPCLIPWPQDIVSSGGAIEFSKASGIAVSDESLQPLAEVLRDDLYLCTSLHLSVKKGRTGTIILRLNPDQEGEAYELTVDDPVVLEGENYNLNLTDS